MSTTWAEYEDLVRKAQEERNEKMRRHADGERLRKDLQGVILNFVDHKLGEVHPLELLGHADRAGFKREVSLAAFREIGLYFEPRPDLAGIQVKAISSETGEEVSWVFPKVTLYYYQEGGF